MGGGNIKSLGRIALFAALMSLCAWFVVPAPVPFTMQTFAVLLAAAVLGGRGAFVSVLVYIASGILGLPVFSGGRAGIGVLLGATGGYIIGFLLCAFVAGKLCEKTKRPILMGLSMLFGLLCDYIIGAVWFFAVYLRGQGFWAAVLTGVVPFIAGDLVKLVLALIVALRLRKIV